jgi:uncharacterized membrane protein
MDKLAPIGRVFFAISLIAFGIQQFLWGDFVPGRAPAWPSGVPGGLVWAYVSGVFLIAAGAAILLGKRGRGAAEAVGAMIFVWALLRHIPLAAADRIYGGAWTNLGKALTFFGGAFAVAGTLPKEWGRSRVAAILDSGDAFTYLGRACLGLFMISSGVQHFLFAQFVAFLVPTWIPGALFWTYFAAVALIAGGAGMNFPPTARLAAALSGLMVFLWFLMLHIPRALAAAEAQSRNEWTAVVESLAVSGIALVLTATRSAAPAAGRSGSPGEREPTPR